MIFRKVYTASLTVLWQVLLLENTQQRRANLEHLQELKIELLFKIWKPLFEIDKIGKMIYC